MRSAAALGSALCSLALLLPGCATTTAEPPGPACPALFPVPTLSVSPRSVRVGEGVTLAVSVLRADEACYAYRISKVEYRLNGQLLASHAADNTERGTFAHTWVPRSGQAGIPASGQVQVRVSARVHSAVGLVEAHPDDPAGDGNDVLVTVTAP